MQVIQVELGARSYPIHIGQGLLSQPDGLHNLIPAQRTVVVTNETIAPLYLSRIERGLGNRQVDSIVLPDGERFKTLSQMEDIIGQMLNLHCGRDTLLIALGGGVIGDMAGFTAATFQRGIPFIQIPTTLLSQVDSSVGGKTAVNHALGKNMIGAFYQPQCVFIDVDTLTTLPSREFSAGIAEVVKYGIIYDAAFFSSLEQRAAQLQQLDHSTLISVIKRCCEIKAEIVAQDEREKGLRALLNLGHTFGHAIEAEMGYGNWLHGEAVAAGMVIACHVSVELGWMDASDLRRVIALLELFNLPVKGPDTMGADAYFKHMKHDKKVSQGEIRFVIPRQLGEACVTSDIPTELLYRILGD